MKNKKEADKKEKAKAKKAEPKRGKAPRKKVAKKAEDEDVDMSANEEEDKDLDEDEDISDDVRKHLEDSFLNIKDRKYEVKPNVINAEYCMKRLARTADDYDDEYVYSEASEYMVYSEKQVRIRYMVEFVMI